MMKTIASIIHGFSPKYFLKIYNLCNLPKRLDMFHIRVLDSLGGSFKEVLCSPSYPTKYASLVRGLDEPSKHIVDTVLLRILNYPEEKHGQVLLSNRKQIVGGLLDVEQVSQREIRKANKKYKLPLEYSHEDSVFYFKHGLRLFDARTIS